MPFFKASKFSSARSAFATPPLYFKVGDVFGVEEPPECYMAYTTEKQEKEALKLYKKMLRSNYQVALETYVRDWKLSGIKKPLEFAQLVLKEQKVFNFKDKKNHDA